MVCWGGGGRWERERRSNDFFALFNHELDTRVLWKHEKVVVGGGECSQ
jgi:hypothetical protein